MERTQRDSAGGGYVCAAVREVEIHRRGPHVAVGVCLCTRGQVLFHPLPCVSVLARCSCAASPNLRPLVVLQLASVRTSAVYQQHWLENRKNSCDDAD